MTYPIGVGSTPGYSWQGPSFIDLRCISVSRNTISLDWRTGECGCDEYNYFYIYDGSTVVGGTSERCYTLGGLCPCSYHNLCVVGLKQCQSDYVYSNILAIQTDGSGPVYPDCGPTPPQSCPPQPYYPQPPQPCPPQPYYPQPAQSCPPQPRPNCNPSTYSVWQEPFDARDSGGHCCPFAPSEVTAEVQQAVSVNLRWCGNNCHSRDTCFHVYKDYIEVATTYENCSQINNLCPGRQYSFCVYAQDGYGNYSPCSNIVNVTTNGHHCC